MASGPFSEFFFIRIIGTLPLPGVGFLKNGSGNFFAPVRHDTIEVKYNGGASAARGISDGPT